MSLPRKRKYHTTRSEKYQRDTSDNHDTSASLYIQAYEADIVKGAAATQAQSLEFRGAPGSSLIQWLPYGATAEEEENRGAVWVDRYDARLLLHEAPSIEHSTSSVDRLSPTGWSDLPSDAEDTFFFSPEEAEDYHREKRRRLIERSREDRLRAIRAEHEEEESEAQEKDLWGDSDEEPDETQKELMRRTASHVLSSPNPAQLEMRILANHGADIRFAFLRGRWSRSWNATKAKVRLALNKDKVQPMSGALGGLSGYGRSDEESGDDAETSAANPEAVIAVDPGQMHAPNDDQADDAAVKEARRAKAKEWSLKRRALKEGKEEPEKS